VPQSYSGTVRGTYSGMVRGTYSGTVRGTYSGTVRGTYSGTERGTYSGTELGSAPSYGLRRDDGIVRTRTKLAHSRSPRIGDSAVFRINQ
jgi:hypothetical protein